MEIPAWMQAAADELAEQAVGTPEAAEQLLELADVLLPLEYVPMFGEFLEAASDALLEVAVDRAREAWLRAQDEEARKARQEARQPFTAAARRRRSRPWRARRRLRQHPGLGNAVRRAAESGMGGNSDE